MLINVQMATIVDILTFISMLNTNVHVHHLRIEGKKLLFSVSILVLMRS